MHKSVQLMTEGVIWKILLRFSFPLFLGGLFQQLYNAVDSWVVGYFCGDNALAAVSSSGSLCYLLVGFFQGVFMGGSVIISHRYGAQDNEGVDKAVHTIVVFSLLMGVTLSILGMIFTPTILRWMATPENVMVNSVLYFRIYCAGLLALVLYNTANGIFQALGDSRHPLYYLIFSSFVNVGLDFLFVAAFRWGVGGAALATVLSQLISAVLAFSHLMSGKFCVRVQLRKLRPDGRVFRQVLRFGLPGGIQNSVIAIANVVVQGNINVFGDNAMAGCGSYSKIEGFVFLPIMSLTMAMTTFVGQNLGAGKPERAHQCAKNGILMTVCFAELIGLFFFLFAPQLIGLFSSTPEVLAFGVRQARVETLFFCLLAFSHGCAAVLRGAGRPMAPMVIMLSIWCIFRIVYITGMVHLIPDITVLFTAYPVTWGISSLLFLCTLLHGDWTRSDKLYSTAEKEKQ